MTKQIIEERLIEDEISVHSEPEDKIELQWDLWLIRGILDHGMQMVDLENAKDQMKKRGESPCHYHYVLCPPSI